MTFFTDFLCHFQRFLGTQVMCLHFVQGPEMTHSYSINILSLQLTLLIEKMLPFETTVSFLLEQLKELMYRTENYFNTVVTFFADQYLKYIMLKMSKTLN
jgi:hypothetical protein